MNNALIRALSDYIAAATALFGEAAAGREDEIAEAAADGIVRLMDVYRRTDLCRAYHESRHPTGADS